MNKIFRIVWNEAAQAWVAVSELTKTHKKRASATAVAAALVAGLLSPFAGATVTAAGESHEFDPADPPSFNDELKHEDNYKFSLVVVDENGGVKTDFGDGSDTEAGKRTISVEPTEGSDGKPTYKSSYLYLRENGGIEIDQEGPQLNSK